jgi:hypothetical protein
MGLGGLREKKGNNSATGSEVNRFFMLANSGKSAEQHGIDREPVALFFLENSEPTVEKVTESFIR